MHLVPRNSGDPKFTQKLTLRPDRPQHAGRVNSRSAEIPSAKIPSVDINVNITGRARPRCAHVTSLFLALITFQAPAFATVFVKTPMRSDAEGISGFSTFTGPGSVSAFLWWVPDTAATGLGRVRRGDVWNPAVTSNKDEGTILQSPFSNAVSDGSLIYYFAGGQLGYKTYGQWIGTPPTALPAPMLFGKDPGSALEVFDGQLFWASYSAGYSQLYSMPKMGGAITTLGAVAGQVKKIKGFESQLSGITVKSVAFLSDSGRLYYKEIGQPTPLTAYYHGATALSNCTDFDVYEHPMVTLVYASTGNASPIAPPGSPGKILAYNGATGTLDGSVAAAGQWQIVDVAAGDGYVWTIQIGNFNCGGLGACTPNDRWLVRYDFTLASKMQVNLGGQFIRDLTHTSEGFMAVQNDYYGDTIYLLAMYEDPSISWNDPPKRALPIMRGDANQNARVDISDVIEIMEKLNSRDNRFSCAAAADTNDDGRVDPTDAVLLLNWIYNDGPPPRSPGPYECGRVEVDETFCSESACETARR